MSIRYVHIFVCSPLRSDTPEGFIENQLLARCYSRWVIQQSTFELIFVPFTAHIFFTQFLDDSIEKEREIGLSLALEMLNSSDQVWVFGSRVSEGMKGEIEHASETEKTVRFKTPSPADIERLKKEILG